MINKTRDDTPARSSDYKISLAKLAQMNTNSKIGSGALKSSATPL